MSVKIIPGLFIWNSMNLWNSLGSVIIYTTLILLVTDCGRILCLFVFSSISLEVSSFLIIEDLHSLLRREFSCIIFVLYLLRLGGFP